MFQFDHLKKKLEEEKEKLENQLKEIAQKNPHSGDWEPKPPDLNPMVSDQSELSDTFEAMDNVVGVEYQLEERLKEILTALERLGSKTYGSCEVCKNSIEAERLEINPAARTCIKHSR